MLCNCKCCCCHLLTAFSKLTVFKTIFQEHDQSVADSLNPDLSQNCYQQTTKVADNKERVNKISMCLGERQIINVNMSRKLCLIIAVSEVQNATRQRSKSKSHF